MKTPTILLLMACSAVVLAVSMDKPPASVAPAQPSEDPTKAPTPNPTTVAPKPTTTTTKAPEPTTTTKAPEPTTTTKAPKPTTTTKAPEPTTTTKAPKPTTTTKAPTPTTTTIPPTTTKPPKNDSSIVGNYTLDNGAQRCLMVQMELRVRLVSAKANMTYMLLPNQTNTGGSCDDKDATLNLFSPGFNLTMSFTKNVTAKTTFVNGLAFNLTHDFGKKGFFAINQTNTYIVNNQSIHLFKTKTGNSYSCKKESLYVGQGLYLDIDQDRMQAFNFSKSNEFGSDEPCPADRSNYRVAIAVGITLLVLVIVVVVAYLLARKKRSDGYQSL